MLRGAGFAADELLAPYGKEMTWDIKAGLMGKRKLIHSRSYRRWPYHADKPEECS